MRTLSRRDFLRAGAAATATSWLALDRAPALGQKRELTMLSFNSFVPASDEELRRQLQPFQGKLLSAPDAHPPRPAYLQRRRAMTNSGE